MYIPQTTIDWRHVRVDCLTEVWSYAGLGGPKEACIRWGAHWRHLAFTTELSMCGHSDVACCQITLTTCYYCYYMYIVVNVQESLIVCAYFVKWKSEFMSDHWTERWKLCQLSFFSSSSSRPTLPAGNILGCHYDCFLYSTYLPLIRLLLVLFRWCIS